MQNTPPREIPTLQQMEQQLRQSEERYRNLFESVPVGLYRTSLDGAFIEANQALVDLFGYPNREMLLAARVTDNYHYPPDRQKWLNAILKTGYLRDYEIQLHRYDGQVIWVRETTHMVKDDQGGIKYFEGSVEDITAQKQAEEEHFRLYEATRRSEEKYRQLFEHMVTGFALHEILVDEAGKPVDYRFLEINSAFENFTGINANNAVGHTAREILPDVESSWIETYGRVALTGESMHFRRYSPEMGRHFDILAYAPQHGQFAVVISNITELVQSEQLLHRRVIELEAVYENSLAISGSLEPHEIAQRALEVLSRKLEWNHAAVRVLRPETDRLDVLAFKRPQANGDQLLEEKQRLQEIIQKPGQGLSGWVAQNGRPVVCGDVDADPRYVKTFPNIHSGLYVPIKLGDNIVGCISVESSRPNAFDENDQLVLSTVAAQAAVAFENARLFETVQQELSERKRAEEALRHLNGELEERVQERTAELRSVNRELERAARLKDEFMASMSHELRTPLTGILNLSEALQEQVYGPLNEKQLKSLRTVEESGRHLLGLINDILDLSKIEAGQLQMSIEACQVGEICQSSLLMIKEMAQRKRQNVSFTINQIPLEIQADARRFKQVLVNLLSNAVKFTPEDGLIGLEVEADLAGHLVRFTVWDHGIGIANEDMPRLFKPFTQLDSSLSRMQTGTGLGLALAQRITDLHGGSVRVESTPGQGSRFTIFLPWKPTEHVPAAQRLSAVGKPMANGVEGTSDSPQLILVVDDNKINTTTYMDYLQVKGYRVLASSDGAEAVDAAHECHPDLILMDIQMPGVNGLEATRRLRSSLDPQVATVPIIALTALAMPGDRERCLAVGANDYLSKPVSLQTLSQTIIRVLNPHK